MRGFLQAIIPFILPFLLYFAWAWLARRKSIESAATVPWIWLSAAGLVLTAAALLWFAESRSLPEGGSYQPARIEDGRIIPGGTRLPGS